MLKHKGGASSAATQEGKFQSSKQSHSRIFLVCSLSSGAPVAGLLLAAQFV